MDNIKGKTRIADAFEVAKMQANNFNAAFPVGTKVTYFKSQIEGRLNTSVTGTAKVFESYPNGKLECVILVNLEHIGQALISKVEPI